MLAFKNWKAFSAEENRKIHNTQQVKQKQEIKRAKNEFEEHLAKDAQTDNEKILKYIKISQLGNGLDCLMTRVLKGEIINDTTIVEKFSEILLSFLQDAQDAEEFPTPCKFFVANRSEDLE